MPQREGMVAENALCKEEMPDCGMIPFHADNKKERREGAVCRSCRLPLPVAMDIESCEEGSANGQPLRCYRVLLFIASFRMSPSHPSSFEHAFVPAEISTAHVAVAETADFRQQRRRAVCDLHRC